MGNCPFGGPEPGVKGALLVAGTHSDAGKSVVTAGICRWLRRQGVSVAPFKAQNMALNSVVTPGGAEIGRAQAVQAAAAGLEPEAAMNPILIKPSGAGHSQIIVNGRPYADATAGSYQSLKHELRPVVAAALADLRARYDVVICEGAGSPAEINLRHADLTNMWLAQEGGLPTLLVADIDRGGVFASLYGTLALLDEADQALIAGYVINKFRGDLGILQPGIDMLEQRTSRPTFGVLPYLDGAWLDVEDSLALEGRRAETPTTGDTLDVAVLRLRWISNFTDADALAAEPGVRVRFTRSAADIERADLVIVPGTKATVEDLELLRAERLDAALLERTGPILGICGGYQLLGRHIDDDVESRRGAVPGLGLLPISTRFAADKVLRRHDVGYEIRHGRITRDGGTPFFADEGCVVGHVSGTSRHGVLEDDGFRRRYLTQVAQAVGRRFVPGTAPFAQARETHLDRLGDLVADHLDTDRLRALIAKDLPCSVS